MPPPRAPGLREGPLAHPTVCHGLLGLSCAQAQGRKRCSSPGTQRTARSLTQPCDVSGGRRSRGKPARRPEGNRAPVKPGTAVAPIHARPLVSRRVPPPAGYCLISGQHPFKGQLAVDSDLPVGLGAQKGLRSRRSRPPGRRPVARLLPTEPRGRARLHPGLSEPSGQHGRGSGECGATGQGEQVSAGECLPGTVPTGNRKGLRPRLPLARSWARAPRRQADSPGPAKRASVTPRRRRMTRVTLVSTTGPRTRRPCRGQPESKSTNPTPLRTAIPGGRCLALAL